MVCKVKNVNETSKSGISDSFKRISSKYVSNPISTAEVAKTIISNDFGSKAAVTLVDTSKKFKFYINNLTISDRSFSISKKTYYLDKEIFGPSKKQRKNGLLINPEGTDIFDIFRLMGGKYWTIEEENKNLIYLNNLSGLPFYIIDYNFVRDQTDKISDIRINRSIFSTSIIKDFKSNFDKLFNDISTVESKKEDTFFGTQQWVMLKANREQFLMPVSSGGASLEKIQKFQENINTIYTNSNKVPTILDDKTGTSLQFSEELWKSFILGGIFSGNNYSTILVEGRDFYDHSFEVFKPFSKKQINNINLVNKPLYADINLEYKFLIESYENSIVNVSETLLPNMYVIFSELSNVIPNRMFERHITLDGLLGRNKLLTRISNIGRIPLDFKKITGDYYEKYAEKIKLYLNSDTKTLTESFAELKSKFTNIVVPITNIKILLSFNLVKYLIKNIIDISNKEIII